MRLIFFVMALLWPVAVAAQEVPADWRRDFPNADFSRSSVEFHEIMSGGPPRDGIPAITDPEIRLAARAHGFAPQEPVLVVDLDGAPARAYPLRYLIWHEIVNDEIAGIPVAVTFCPLCNTAMVFDARLDGQVLHFGVSGRLRHSDMIMYDQETETWWQQATAEAIVGTLTGAQLVQLPAWLDSWENFRRTYPEGEAMAQPSWPRSYGVNPYAGYDQLTQPFLYRGENPPHGIPALARVVRVGDRAWPLTRLRAAGRLEEAGLVLDWQAGQASALGDRQIARGRDVGSVRVRDAQGRDVVHDLPFAFAFHAFHPNGIWMID